MSVDVLHPGSRYRIAFSVVYSSNSGCILNCMKKSVIFERWRNFLKHFHGTLNIIRPFKIPNFFKNGQEGALQTAVLTKSSLKMTISSTLGGELDSLNFLHHLFLFSMFCFQ